MINVREIHIKLENDNSSFIYLYHFSLKSLYIYRIWRIIRDLSNPESLRSVRASNRDEI